MATEYRRRHRQYVEKAWFLNLLQLWQGVPSGIPESVSGPRKRERARPNNDQGKLVVLDNRFHVRGCTSPGNDRQLASAGEYCGDSAMAWVTGVVGFDRVGSAVHRVADVLVGWLAGRVGQQDVSGE
jgi:hypothetical protein